MPFVIKQMNHWILKLLIQLFLYQWPAAILPTFKNQIQAIFKHFQGLALALTVCTQSSMVLKHE